MMSYINMFGTGWLRLVGSLKSSVSFAECHLFHRALLQKRPIILRSLIIVATPCTHKDTHNIDTCAHAYTNTNTHAYTYIHLSVSRYVYIHTYRHVHIGMKNIYSYAQIHIFICVCERIYAYVCIYVHIYI